MKMGSGMMHVGGFNMALLKFNSMSKEMPTKMHLDEEIN